MRPARIVGTNCGSVSYQPNPGIDTLPSNLPLH